MVFVACNNKGVRDSCLGSESEESPWSLCHPFACDELDYGNNQSEVLAMVGVNANNTVCL